MKEEKEGVKSLVECNRMHLPHSTPDLWVRRWVAGRQVGLLPTKRSTILPPAHLTNEKWLFFWFDFSGLTNQNPAF